MARSRTEPASRVERARMLLAYRKDPSFFAVGQALGVHHQTVQRCVERALAYGAMAALDDRPRPGKEPTITAEARTWLGVVTALAACWAFVTCRAGWRCLKYGQAATTAVRHVSIAAARSVRCVWADVRWRWTLKVL